jgi:hypothetical protein
MTCNELNEQFDDYMDGQPGDFESLDAHVANCVACQDRVGQEQQLRRSLRDYGASSMPVRDAAFFDRALARAAAQGSKQQHKHSWLKGFGSAIAAGLALWIISGVLLTGPEFADPDAAVPAVSMALEKPRTINLVFSSATDLENATLTVNLPFGVEIAGFEGQQEISWMTSLQKGKNVLPLRLIATSPQGGELLATLQHANDDKSFRLRVTVI